MRMNSHCVIICSCWQFSCHWDYFFQLLLSLSIKIAFFTATFFFSAVLFACPALYIFLLRRCVWMETERAGVSSKPGSRVWAVAVGTVQGRTRTRSCPLVQRLQPFHWFEKLFLHCFHWPSSAGNWVISYPLKEWLLSVISLLSFLRIIFKICFKYFSFISLVFPNYQWSQDYELVKPMLQHSQNKQQILPNFKRWTSKPSCGLRTALSTEWPTGRVWKLSAPNKL